MTSVVDLKGRSAIEAEAQAWIIKLDGEGLSRQDREALREWTGRSPQHRATLREMAEMWGALDGLAALEPILASAPTVRAAAAAPRRRSGGNIWAGAAAAMAALCLVAVALGYVLWSDGGAHTELYATGVGQQRQIVLADGSEVTLNTDSAIEVSYERSARRIRLIEGEALFTVASDPGRPFVVAAQRAAVRAVGTAFAVRMEPDVLNVTVSEGVVAVVADIASLDVPEAASHVAAGHVAMLSSAQYRMYELTPADLERRLAWSHGLMIFEGEPLSKVLAEAGRYTNLQFEIADPELSRMEIGGRFEVGKIEALLDALSTSFGVEIERRDGLVRLSRPDPA